MTEEQLEEYFWKVLDRTTPKEQTDPLWNARSLIYYLSNNICDKYGRVPVAPTNISETINPFTIHFNWEDNKGNVLGCSINEKPDIYVCFSSKEDSWSEYLVLPDIEVSKRLMDVFYFNFLKKTEEWKGE